MIFILSIQKSRKCRARTRSEQISVWNVMSRSSPAGQRTKVLLGKLLLEKPDILLLDEPTNYLDESRIEWLKRYSNDYENAFILISHDIPFLNSVINLIYHIDNGGTAPCYVGNYGDAVRAYEVKKAQLEAAYKKQQQEISERKDFVARNKGKSCDKKYGDVPPEKTRQDGCHRTGAAQNQSREFRFVEARTPGKFIFETTDLVIGSTTNHSPRPLNLAMERGAENRFGWGTKTESVKPHC